MVVSTDSTKARLPLRPMFGTVRPAQSGPSTIRLVIPGKALCPLLQARCDVIPFMDRAASACKNRCRAGPPNEGWFWSKRAGRLIRASCSNFGGVDHAYMPIGGACRATGHSILGPTDAGRDMTPRASVRTMAA